MSFELFQSQHQNIIESVSIEIDTNDGYWVYLRPGYRLEPGLHVIHEMTLKEIYAKFKKVSKCECTECSSLVHQAYGWPSRKVKNVQI